MRNSTNNILLVRPASFGFNAETAKSNAFQNRAVFDAKEILEEFDTFAEKLREHGISVTVFEDTPDPPKPDAIFPNNWVSLHEDGKVVLYPMLAENRRLERRPEIIEGLKKRFDIKEIIDLSKYEAEGKFLEGTGSIVFDHANKAAYACLSPRTNKKLFENISTGLGYEPVSFRAADRDGKEIYHTNVMMCIGDGFAVVCLESIGDSGERSFVEEKLLGFDKEIVEISFEQMQKFAGNMLAVLGRGGENFLVMSQSAHDSLDPEQKKTLEKWSMLLPIPIPSIEKTGGGSARCMMAEIFAREL